MMSTRELSGEPGQAPYALLCSNFVGEKPFSPYRNKITVQAAPTFLDVTE